MSKSSNLSALGASQPATMGNSVQEDQPIAAFPPGLEPWKYQKLPSYAYAAPWGRAQKEACLDALRAVEARLGLSQGEVTILRARHSCLEGLDGPHTDAEFEALPRPQPVPYEGDIIAYRLLHGHAGMTPQVSEWRKGQVIHWDEGTKTLIVGPCQAHAGGKPSGLDKQEEVTSTAAGGQDVPAWHYNADGELTAALQAFADLRIIGEPHAPPAGSAAGSHIYSTTLVGTVGGAPAKHNIPAGLSGKTSSITVDCTEPHAPPAGSAAGLEPWRFSKAAPHVLAAPWGKEQKEACLDALRYLQARLRSSNMEAARLRGHIACLEGLEGPHTDADYEALPRPQPVPYEGDIIGYRLLSAGKVSNWRKGQVIHWEEGTETLVVGPPPLHCKAGGEFTATLKQFADLRIIAEPHAPPASNTAGSLTYSAPVLGMVGGAPAKDSVLAGVKTSHIIVDCTVKAGQQALVHQPHEAAPQLKPALQAHSMPTPPRGDNRLDIGASGKSHSDPAARRGRARGRSTSRGRHSNDLGRDLKRGVAQMTIDENVATNDNSRQGSSVAQIGATAALKAASTAALTTSFAMLGAVEASMEAGARCVERMRWRTSRGAAASVGQLRDTQEPSLPVRALRKGVRSAYGAIGALAGITQAILGQSHLVG